MSTLANVSGFSGGYVVSTPNGGLSTFSLTTGYTYTSGNNIIWDVSSVDPSITYNTSTGAFTAVFAGIYLVKMFVGVTGMATGQSIQSNIGVGANPLITMGMYSGNAAQAGGILTCPFIVDLNLTAGQAFKFSMIILSPTTIDLLGSPDITSSILYLG